MDMLFKKIMIFSLLAVLIVFSGCGGGQKSSGPVNPGGTLVAIDKAIDVTKIGVAKWLDNASYAVTFTFDDNLETHYTLIAPLLEEYNFRGSFFINPGRNTIELYPTWDPVKEGHRQLAAKGHEIGSHTWTHPNLATDPLTLAAIREEIEKPIQQIFNDIGYRPVSFVHPYNETNAAVDSIVFEKYLFTRMSSLHSMNDRLLMDLISSTPETSIQTNLNSALQGHKWLIVAGHGAIRVQTGWEPVTTNFLRKFCDLIKTSTQPVFVGTMAQVGAYEYLRQEITVHTQINNNQLQIVISGFTPERYSSFSSLPLTLILPSLPFEGNLKVNFDGKEIRYDSQIGAFVGTIDLTKQTSVIVSAVK